MTVSLQDKWLFLGAVMGDPDLPGSAKSAAYFLLDHLNTRTERCDPSLVGLAERMDMSRQSAIDGIAALIAGGYFERVSGGSRGIRTKYRPCWETVKQALQFQDPETVKQSTINGKVELAKTVKHTCHETGNLNREETGKENPLSGDSKLAPSAESEKTTPAPKKYAFEGEVIRLIPKHFDEWAGVYHGIPDLRAELTALDVWCAKHWREGSRHRKDWYQHVSRLLNKKHQERLAKQNSPQPEPEARYSDGVY